MASTPSCCHVSRLSLHRTVVVSFLHHLAHLIAVCCLSFGQRFANQSGCRVGCVDREEEEALLETRIARHRETWWNILTVSEIEGSAVRSCFVTGTAKPSAFCYSALNMGSDSNWPQLCIVGHLASSPLVTRILPRSSRGGEHSVTSAKCIWMQPLCILVG